MAKPCYLIWGDDGMLTCTIQHMDRKNCDIAKAEAVGGKMTPDEESEKEALKQLLNGAFKRHGYPADAQDEDVIAFAHYIHGKLRKIIVRQECPICSAISEDLAPALNSQVHRGEPEIDHNHVLTNKVRREFPPSASDKFRRDKGRRNMSNIKKDVSNA